MSVLIRFRNLLLLLTVILTVAAIPVAQQLTFDQTIESFFAPDNPDIRLLSRSRREFGGDEFVIVAWPEPELLTTDGERGVPELNEAAAARISELAQKLDAIPGINPNQTRHLVKFLENTPKSRNTRSALLKLFEGVLLGKDGQTTAIILQLRPTDQSPEPRSTTLQAIRAIANEFDSGAAVAGEPVQIHDMFEMVENDGQILYLFSLVVLSAMLVVIFRGIRWMAGAIGIVMASVMCTRASLVLAGAQLSMVSSMLNSLVTVIAVATVMHVIVTYREYRRNLDAEAATLETLKELWLPVFWSMVTTAVGFSSLMISDIIPVQSFALMMTVATGMVLLFLMTVTPALLASGKNVRIPGRAPLEDQLDRTLTRAAQAIEVHPLWSGSICLVLMLISAPGLLMLTVETDFSRNFRESSPIVKSLKFVETHLGGAGTWEVAFNVPEQLPDEFLKSTKQLTESLEHLADEGLELDVLSLNDAVDMPPRLGSMTSRLERLQRRQSDLVNSFYNPSERRMRIVLRSREQQSADAKIAQIERVRAVVQEHFAGQPEAEATASGLYVLLAHLIESLLQDQLKSFLITTSGILLSMTIAFRSLRLGLISLFPNIFPVVLVIGTLGVLGIPINIGTAMIASVSMGLTVDSTIHYITAFERARRVHSVQESLKIAHGGAGRAVVLAYLALVAGFLVLTVSAFIPLVYFGALLSLSMVGGLVGDLILLPLMLRWLTPARHAAVRDSSTQSPEQ